MSRLIDEKRQYCNAKLHNVACECYKLAESEFLARAGKTSFWESYCEGSKKLNFEGTKYLPSPPASFSIYFQGLIILPGWKMSPSFLSKILRFTFVLT